MVLTSDLDGKFSPKRGFRPFFLTVLFLRWGRLLPEVIQILTSFLTVLFLLRWELLLPEVTKILTSFLTVLFLRWERLLPEVIQILTSFLTVLFLLRWSRSSRGNTDFNVFSDGNFLLNGPKPYGNKDFNVFSDELLF